MKTTIKKINELQSIIEVETKSGVMTLEINKTRAGHSYNDFAEWDITDMQYYNLEKLVDDIIDKMKGDNVLEVSYEF